MDSIYLSPEKRGTAEITEKRSRFIGNIVHVDSEEEAVEFVKQIKKEYYDAKHSAYAYITGGVKRYSDDGEPAKTAGLPILDMLDAQKNHRLRVRCDKIFWRSASWNRRPCESVYSGGKKCTGSCRYQENDSSQQIQIHYPLFVV